MKIYFAADHAGFKLKNELVAFVRDEFGYEVEDCGAFELNLDDDYPEFVSKAAEAVSGDPGNRKAIVLGGSGQGEAIVANRHKGVRAVVYYGEPDREQKDASGNELTILASTRTHNDANVLSLGARFIDGDAAKRAVTEWLKTPFGGEERHTRRIEQIDL